MRIVMLSAVALLCGILASCGSPEDKNKSAAAPTASPAAAPAAKPAAPPAAAPKAEPATTPAAVKPAEAATDKGDATAAVALPDGLPKLIHIYPKMKLTSVTTVDKSKDQYEIHGSSLSSVADVLNYYEKYFRDNGWTEDSIMVERHSSIISFKKDGLLEFIESLEGDGGSKITITTGRV